MTSIVLAGGRSVRLGRDKAWERLGGETLIERVIKRLSKLSAEIIVVTAEGRKLPSIDRDDKTRIVNDLYPQKGSLGGIYTGLVNASAFHSLVVACDMPFLNLSLLEAMADIASGFDVVMPRVNGKLEPLHAIYSKNCISPIEALIKQNQLKIVTFLDAVRVHYFDEAEIRPLDPDYSSFFNINTESDLMVAKSLIEEKSALSSRLDHRTDTT